MSITIKSLGYGKVAVLQNGKHIKTFTGMSAPNDARMWVANQYKSSQPDTSTGSVAKNENVHHTAAEIYRKMQEGNLKGNQEKIDANKNGKIDSEDFKILRSKKKDTCEADCKESVEHLEEKLTTAQPVSKWIDDFINSDNPKFAGKSKEERRQMALGAYYAAKNEDTQSELGSHPDGYKKVGQRWKKAQKQDQQGKPEKSYEYADKPATGLTKEGLSFANTDFDGEIIAEEFDIELDEDNTSYEACLEIVKEQYGIESLRELDSEIADEFFESVEMLHNDIHAIAETYTRHEVEQRVAQHKKAGRKVSDVRYSIKQGQPYAEYTVTEPDGVQRKYIYHGNITKHERLN